MKKITKLAFILLAIFAGHLSVSAQNTECAGTSTEAASGYTFDTGYNYSFTTSGTDVTFTCELLDNKDGVVAYAWTYNPNFAEVAMTNVSGKLFSKTFTGQTLGSSFNVACKFAYAGGMTVTKTYTYTVGNTCGGVADTEKPTAFTATAGTITANSIELLLNAEDNSGAVSFSIVYGSTTLTTSSASGVQKSYIVTGLTPSTAYSFAVTAKDASDNVSLNSPITVNASTTALAEPTTAAPTPPARTAAKVISIFSDAYSDISGTNFNPNWGQSTVVTTVQIESNNTLKYANLNYQGTAFSHIYPIGTGMTDMHIDVWTANETSLSIYPICWNGSGNEPEKFVTKTISAGEYGSWISYDIPLTDFTSQGLTMNDVYQIKIVGSGGKTVFLDNIYFYNSSASTDTEAPANFTATKGNVTADEVELLLSATDNSGAVNFTISYGSGPTVLNTTALSGVQKSYVISGLTGATEYNFSVVAKDASDNVAANSPIVVNATTLTPLAASPVPSPVAGDVFSIYSDAYTATATGVQYQSWWNAGWSDITLANGGNAKKIVSNNGGGGGGIQFNDLDVSSMTYIHMDVYPTDATVNILKYNVVPVGGGGTGWTSFPTLIANQWNSVDVLTSTLGLPGTSVFQVGFGTFGGEGTFYVDNIFFSKTISTSISNTLTNDVSIYPNPMKDQLNINSESEIKSIEIYNIMGQLVKNISTNSLEKVIDMSSFAAGNYFVSVKLANGLISTQKIVKM